MVREGVTVFIQSPAPLAQILQGSGGTKDRPGGRSNLLRDGDLPDLAWVWPGKGRAGRATESRCLPAARRPSGCPVFGISSPWPGYSFKESGFKTLSNEPTGNVSFSFSLGCEHPFLD